MKPTQLCLFPPPETHNQISPQNQQPDSNQKHKKTALKMWWKMWCTLGQFQTNNSVMCKHIKLSHTHTCTGCKPLRRLPMPSTVTTCIPSTEYRGARHALIARCLQCTTNQTNQLGVQIGLFFQFLSFLLSRSLSSLPPPPTTSC